jgi:alpha-mannosidase
MEIPAQLPSATRQIQVVDGAGKAVASQLLSADDQTQRVRLLAQVDVPSLGYKTYYVRAVAKGAVAGAAVHGSADTLENELVRVKVDATSGCITSLFDKQSNSETLAPAETDTGGPKTSICGNLLQAFRDKPKDFDAWNIDADFEKEHWDLTKADEVSVLEKGPLRAVIRVKKHFQNSSFIQDITLAAGSPRVDVRMSADWHEKHILLKVTFPVKAHSDKATFEIPYGTIERPTTRNTPAEQAQFEVPALQWADLSDAQHGLSVLNDCKYGYDAKGNVLRLSLLRSPEWPDPHADEGAHEFTYSMYPHAGGWKEAQTVRRGYELNYPLLALQVEKHRGQVKDELSFFEVSAPNVVVTALKKAEDDGAFVVRFYELAGQPALVKLNLPAAADSASETDLMERPVHDLSIQSRSVSVDAKPYEIKTLRIRFPAKSDARWH